MVDDPLAPLLARVQPIGAVSGSATIAGHTRHSFTKEAALVASAVPARIREHAAGRAAAHAALMRLGHAASTALLSDDDRVPCWPVGIVGSITHAAGVAAAVVASDDKLTGLGIDVEAVAALREDLWSMVLRDDELARHATLPVAVRGSLATALFCIKEAAYKALFPSLRIALDFRDVAITVDATRLAGASGLTADLAACVVDGPLPARGAAVEGRVATDGRVWLACAWR